MSTQAHTPGPWGVFAMCTSPRGAVAGVGRACFIIKRPGRDELIEVFDEGDARLIAAAPDLLAAIKNSDDAHWTTAMRAAMAKAEGQS